MTSKCPQVEIMELREALETKTREIGILEGACEYWQEEAENPLRFITKETVTVLVDVWDEKEARIKELEKAAREVVDSVCTAPAGDYYYSPQESQAMEALSKALEQGQ